MADPMVGRTTPRALWATFSLDQTRIRKRLLVKGWTLAKWAAEAQPHVSSATASRLIQGLPVQPAKAAALIRALGLPPEEVIEHKQAVQAV